MTYDDASWHHDSVLEHGLDGACAATHIGMFFAWLADHGMVDPQRIDVTALVVRNTTPGRFLLSRCAGEIDQFMLTPGGAAFTAAAYDPYLCGYQYIPQISRYTPSYAAPDTWDTYGAVSPTIDEAYAAFLES